MDSLSNARNFVLHPEKPPISKAGKSDVAADSEYKRRRDGRRAFTMGIIHPRLSFTSLASRYVECQPARRVPHRHGPSGFSGLAATVTDMAFAYHHRVPWLADHLFELLCRDGGIVARWAMVMGHGGHCGTRCGLVDDDLSWHRYGDWRSGLA